MGMSNRQHNELPPSLFVKKKASKVKKYEHKKN